MEQNTMQRMGGYASVAMVILAIWAIFTQFHLTWVDVLVYCGIAYLGAMALATVIIVTVVLRGYRRGS